jgi:hypothetical protein
MHPLCFEEKHDVAEKEVHGPTIVIAEEQCLLSIQIPQPWSKSPTPVETKTIFKFVSGEKCTKKNV